MSLSFVYVVEYCDGDDVSEVIGVFSTRHRAERFVRRIEPTAKKNEDGNFVHPFIWHKELGYKGNEYYYVVKVKLDEERG